MSECMEDCEMLTATEASRAFSDVLHRVCYGGQSFVIKKGNRLMARIVPVEPVEQEAAAQAAEEAQTDENAAPMPEIAGDEAEYYKAWIEQVRKVEV